MAENDPKTNAPLPGRMEVLRELPADILKSLTKEEIRVFLFEETWPLDLSKKLEKYLA